jgi:hypothetical protein
LGRFGLVGQLGGVLIAGRVDAPSGKGIRRPLRMRLNVVSRELFRRRRIFFGRAFLLRRPCSSATSRLERSRLPPRLILLAIGILIPVWVSIF